MPSRSRPLHLALLFVLFGLPFLPAHAGRIDAGTVEAGLSLSLDFEGPNGRAFSGDLLGGYFVTHGVLAGARLEFLNDDDWSSLAVYGTVEQHFETDTPWIPYVGGELGVRYFSLDDESETALVLGLRGGVKFYLTEMAALDLSLNVALASADVYLSNQKPDNVDVTLRLGLRFFLN